MKLSARMLGLAAKFDALSLRERLLVLAAALAILIVGSNHLLTARLQVRRTQLLGELTALQSGMSQGASTESGGPTSDVFIKGAELKSRLASVDAELQTESAGLIAPRRMAEVLRDVLRLQHSVVLVSLRNLPAAPLSPAAPDQTSSGPHAPYVHSVELVLEGRYLDILEYLQALEALPWHFYWKRLELTTTHYPTNQVRLELSTVSMDRDWLDL